MFGDCRKSMREMIAQGVRVQTCVTSPPYWGLRDYGIDGQLGLESTPEEYVANMVEVFRLVRELLADDGTLWLNLGDSYAGSSQQGQNNLAASVASTRGGAKKIDSERFDIKREMPNGLKPKDLVGIPWRVAFALQADGWYLRSDIIWHKPNPMPESVTDRPTKAHEYLFLLSKRERYFYDAESVREPHSINTHTRYADGPGPSPKAIGIDKRNAMSGVGLNGNDASEAGRNRRTVWTVATEPYSEAHFATFPMSLIEPCILAGSRVGDIVFDPFLGSGTTAQVAQNLGRHWLGCELSEPYGKLQKRRTGQLGMALI